MTVTFIIPQQPKGKMRHQTVVSLRCATCQREQYGQQTACSKCGAGKMYFVRSMEYSPRDQKEYEKFAAMCAQQGMQGMNKFVGAAGIHCDFFFEIPKSRKKLQEGDWHTQRPDTDNCVKSIWDACNQICFADDCTISFLVASKRWTRGCPRTEVRIESL